MKVKIVAGIGAFVLVAGGLAAYTAFTPPVQTLVAEDELTAKPITAKQYIPSEGVAETSQPGRYIAYQNDDSIRSTKGTKLLFFHAPWCPQCRNLEKDIKETQLPDNLTIFKVDYDSAGALRTKYGVTLQTTVVKVDDAGQLVKKFVAYARPNFETVKLNLLD